MHSDYKLVLVVPTIKITGHKCIIFKLKWQGSQVLKSCQTPIRATCIYLIIWFGYTVYQGKIIHTLSH